MKQINRFFIYRNSTLENLFDKTNFYSFSDYDGITKDSSDYNIYVWFYIVPIKFESQSLVEEINDLKFKLEFVKDSIEDNKPLLLFSLTEFKSYDFGESIKISNAVNEVNNFMYELSLKHPSVYYVETKNFILNNLSENILDWRYFFMSKTIINPKLKLHFNNWFNTTIKNCFQPRKKCLVLDLDNTLWGGILGEDGINGIKLGESYPGNCFKRFQEYILEIKNAGIILSICSKNNFSDVKELFNNHEEIVLQLDDFLHIKCNWENKADNINQIAKELNIGLDSIVFIDDNPTEREIVKMMLPDVTVPDFPKKPFDLIEFIDKINLEFFSVSKLSDEDKKKTQLYKENEKRKQLRNTIISFEDYIKNLKIKLNISLAKETNISRLTQLSQKTNQFNLTTRRYSEHDIINYINSGNFVFYIDVSDKFGGSGITGLAILLIDNENLIIDTFLMSCRVLGKTIEKVFLHELLNYFKESEYRFIKSSWIQTKKNQQTKSFFDDNGFEIIYEGDNEKKYRIDLDSYVYNQNRNIKTTFNK